MEKLYYLVKIGNRFDLRQIRYKGLDHPHDLMAQHFTAEAMRELIAKHFTGKVENEEILDS